VGSGRLVTAIYVTKHLMWTAPPDQREDLQALLAFLVEQCHAVDEAEVRIGGRALAMAAPSAHARRNLLGEVGSDADAALGRHVERLSDLADEITADAAQLGPGDEAAHLVQVAAAMRDHLTDLRGGPR
jgi:hypothetical protein